MQDNRPQVQEDLERVVRRALIGVARTGLAARPAVPRGPSSTWTYVVNDDQFEHRFALQMISSAGVSAASALLWPLTMLYLLARRYLRRN